MDNKMINPDLEKMIAEEILANKGSLTLDANDIKQMKDISDYLDGDVADGKLDDIEELSKKTINQLKDAHSQDKITALLLKLRVDKGAELLTCQVGTLYDVFSLLDDDVSVKWGVEFDATLCDEVRVIVLCGFKRSDNQLTTK